MTEEDCKFAVSPVNCECHITVRSRLSGIYVFPMKTAYCIQFVLHGDGPLPMTAKNSTPALAVLDADVTVMVLVTKSEPVVTASWLLVVVDIQ